MKRTNLSGCLLIMIVGLMSTVWGGVDHTDFVEDVNCNTNLWEMSETELDGNGRKFSDGGECIVSPVYGGAVVEVSVSAKTYSTGDGSSLKIESRTPGSEDWREVHRLVFADNSATNETFALTRADNCRQFRLTFVKGKGTLRIGSFRVVWRADGEVAIPSELTADDVAADSFHASWTIDEAVDCFLFDCWRESMTKWTGEEKWSETFGKCVNEGKSGKRLTAETFDQYTDCPGWSGDPVYVPAGGNGTIQVNKASDSVGWLVSPSLPEMSSVELVVRARAFKMQSDHVMPVCIIRGGATNDVAAFELDASFGDFHCPIEKIMAGDRLAFKSFSVGSQRRVLIDSVALVAGFEAGYAVTNSVCDGVVVEYSEMPGFQVEELDDGSVYAFSVRAVSGGTTSAASEVCKVETLYSDAVEDAGDWPGGTASEISHTSFRLDWPEMSGAESYRVSVWTNVMEGASVGRTVWSESFSKAMASSSTTAIADDEKFAEDYAEMGGWMVMSNVYPSVDAGTVRLGNTSKPGELMMPQLLLPAGRTLRVRMRRQTSGEGAIFGVWRISGETVEQIGDSVEIGEEFRECVWTLPETGASDRLVFRSVTGKDSYRTILDEVEILDGYSAGSPVPDHALEAEEVDGTSYTARELPTAMWSYSVEAIAESGEVMAAVTNTVDLVNPPPQPVLDAVLLSEIRRSGGMRIWDENFNFLTNVFPASKNGAGWLNGTTLPHWQAYYGGVAVTDIKRNNGAATQKGMYAYWATNKVVDTYSLGTLTSGDAEEFIYGLAFRNDTAFTARRISVKYDGVQFGFKNKDVQELVCECLVTNELVSVVAEGDWHVCEDLTYRTLNDNSSGLVSGKDLPVATRVVAELPEINVLKDSYLLLRWRRSAVSSAAAIAIDNVTVSFVIQSRPMVIVVR